MSDVLDNERGPAPMWVVPVAMLAVVALVVALAWRWTGSNDADPAPAVSFSPAAGPTPAPLPSPSLAGNACGGDIEQPLIDAGALPPDTGLRVLVGDRDLRLLDVDTGTTKVLAARTDQRAFTVLAQTANEVLTVLRDPCSPAGFGTGEVGIVNPVTGAVTARGRGDEILPGEPVTVAQFDQDGAIRLRELGSQKTTGIPPGWRPYARTSTGYIASVIRNGFDSGVPPELGIGVPTRATLSRPLGTGEVVAATPDRLYWVAGECPGPNCLLTWTTLDGTNTAQAVDAYACCGSVSPDGMKLAFRKSRPGGRFGGHPGPPQDIAVLDTTTGGGPIAILKGLTLPAKGGVTLAWSPDSQWLVVGADLGTGPAVMIWRQGMDRPARVPIPPTGGGTTGPPALLVLPR